MSPKSQPAKPHLARSLSITHLLKHLPYRLKRPTSLEVRMPTESATRPLLCVPGMVLPSTTSATDLALPPRLLSVHYQPGFWHKKFSFPKPNRTHKLAISIDVPKNTQVHKVLRYSVKRDLFATRWAQLVWQCQ